MTRKTPHAAGPACGEHDPQAGFRQGIRPGFRPWLRLLAGFLLILVFIFGMGSLLKLIPGARHMAQVIDEGNIRATAVFYTDFEEPAKGSEMIRTALEYQPQKRQTSEK